MASLKPWLNPTVLLSYDCIIYLLLDGDINKLISGKTLFYWGEAPLISTPVPEKGRRLNGCFSED